MKLNLDKPFTGLDGELIEDSNLGKTLADFLAKLSKGDAVKYLEWAIALHNKKPIEVDKSDYDTLISEIKRTELLQNLVKGQFLNELRDQKDALEKPNPPKEGEPVKK